MFRHAICQSGSSLDRWAVVENPKLLAMEVAKNLDCPTSSSELLVACLKTKPAEEIVKAEFTVGHNAALNLCTLISPTYMEIAFVTFVKFFHARRQFMERVWRLVLSLSQ